MVRSLIGRATVILRVPQDLSKARCLAERSSQLSGICFFMTMVKVKNAHIANFRPLGLRQRRNSVFPQDSHTISAFSLSAATDLKKKTKSFHTYNCQGVTSLDPSRAFSQSMMLQIDIIIVAHLLHLSMCNLV